MKKGALTASVIHSMVAAAGRQPRPVTPAGDPASMAEIKLYYIIIQCVPQKFGAAFVYRIDR